jgi:hypothetical protein
MNIPKDKEDTNNAQHYQKIEYAAFKKNHLLCFKIQNA